MPAYPRLIVRYGMAAPLDNSLFLRQLTDNNLTTKRFVCGRPKKARETAQRSFSPVQARDECWQLTVHNGEPTQSQSSELDVEGSNPPRCAIVC